MRILENLAAAIMVALLIFGFTNIVMRTVLGGGLIWYSDVGRYALVWMVLIGAAAISFRGAHIRIDVGLEDRLPSPLRRLLAAIRFAAMGIFLAILLVESAKLTLSTIPQNFITVRWLSLGWAYVALPVATALMLLALVLRALRPGFGAAHNGDQQ